MRLALSIAALSVIGAASAAQAGFVFSHTVTDLPNANKQVILRVVNDGIGGTGTEWLGQTIVYNNPGVPTFWRTSGALAARQYNGGGNTSSSDPVYDPNFSHINAVPQTAAAADVRPFVASAFVNGVAATGTTWGAAAGITNFSIDFAATGDAASFVPSAVTPFNFATLVVPDAATTLSFSGLIGGRTGGSIPYTYTANIGGGPLPTPQFSAGTLGGADARQSLTSTGDNPTIYTLTVNFGNIASIPASFSIDTNMTDSGTIATVGASPSAGITGLTATGDVISGNIDGFLRGSFDIQLTGSGTTGDSAILRIVAIPEPTTLAGLAGVALLALRRRK
jgi:hypothetical protein